MDNNYNFNFIDDGDIRPQTTESQTENPNVNYNNSYSMMNTNTPDNVTNMSSQSYPIASSDLSFPLPQYTQQIQQAQQPIYQQNNTENNIQQQLFDTTQPISLNVPHFVQNSSSPFDASQINHSEIFTFEIPGIKIIVIPTFPPMINSSQTNNSEIFTFDIPGSKVIIITLSFQ